MNAVPRCPPVSAGLSSRLLDSWLEGWSAAVSGLSALVPATLAGRIDPLDTTRWLALASARQPPSWGTPHELVFETPIARLRDFSAAGETCGVVPTLVLPPQAGHDSCIVDYSAEQSQMRTILGCGLTRAYSLDWIGATDETKDASIDAY